MVSRTFHAGFFAIVVDDLEESLSALGDQALAPAAGDRVDVRNSRAVSASRSETLNFSRGGDAFRSNATATALGVSANINAVVAAGAREVRALMATTHARYRALLGRGTAREHAIGERAYTT